MACSFKQKHKGKIMNNLQQIFAFSALTIPLFIMTVITINGIFVDIKKTKDEVIKKLQISIMVLGDIIFFFLWANLVFTVIRILEEKNMLMLNSLAASEIFLFLIVLFILRRSK